jgi:2-keto-3-deoxy-L-rhamnonate aldolase RhmA
MSGTANFKMRKKEKHVGAWLALGSSVIAELASLYPFHWILFDLEHGCATEATLLSNLQAAKQSNKALIVRPGSCDTALISRILDWGAHGIMMPHINTPQQAVECLHAMQYPPHGHKGYSSSARAFNFGVDQLATQQNTEPPLFFAQIETEIAVKNCSDIAKVNGVDVLFIGPADLKWDLTANGNMSDNNFNEAIKHIIDAALTNGKQVGIVAKTPEEMKRFLNMGITCITYASDLSFLKQGFQQVTDTFLS